MAFPGGSDGKESACNAGHLGLIPGSGKFPWRREWQPAPLFFPGESHGQRNLGGYSPWGHKETDKTELPTLSLSLRNPPSMVVGTTQENIDQPRSGFTGRQRAALVAGSVGAAVSHVPHEAATYQPGGF